MLPSKLIEEFEHNYVGIRLLPGNIYASEVLLGLIVMFSSAASSTIFFTTTRVLWQKPVVGYSNVRILYVDNGLHLLAK